MRVDEKVYKKICTSDSKLVVSEMLKQKHSLCFHQTDISFFYLEAQNICSRDKGTVTICSC